MIRRPSCILIGALLLGACASGRESSRTRLVVPNEVGAVYSDVEMQARLALKDSTRCTTDCDETTRFRRRVEALGQRLAIAAKAVAADLQIAAPPLVVSAPGKDDIGTLSSASGSIMVFDGLRDLNLSDAALAFVIAREMGHVLGRHHEENTATGLAVSAAVTLLFPVTGLLQGVQAAYTATTAGTLATTATSFAGARVMRSFYADEQRHEADEFALLILVRAGWWPRDVAQALRLAAFPLEGEGWLAELQGSQRWVVSLDCGPSEELCNLWPPEPSFEPAFARIPTVVAVATPSPPVAKAPVAMKKAPPPAKKWQTATRVKKQAKSPKRKKQPGQRRSGRAR